MLAYLEGKMICLLHFDSELFGYMCLLFTLFPLFLHRIVRAENITPTGSHYPLMFHIYIYKSNNGRVVENVEILQYLYTVCKVAPGPKTKSPLYVYTCVYMCYIYCHADSPADPCLEPIRRALGRRFAA